MLSCNFPYVIQQTQNPTTEDRLNILTKATVYSHVSDCVKLYFEFQRFELLSVRSSVQAAY